MIALSPGIFLREGKHTYKKNDKKKNKTKQMNDQNKDGSKLVIAVIDN